MANFSGMLYAAVLGREVRLSVVLPQDAAGAPARPKKTLLLLHGLGDTNEAWLNKSLVLRLAEKNGIAVLMPECGCSFCCDSHAGERWFVWLAEELPSLAQKLFHLSDSPRDWLVAGQSMGGYGALRLALCCPERYGAAGVFSPAWDLQRLLFAGDVGLLTAEMTLRIRKELFGSATALPEEADIRSALKKAAEKCPIYLSMGREDPLWESCGELRSLLRENDWPFLYEEFSGAHEWPVWHPSLEHFLRWVMQTEESPAICAARELLVQDGLRVCPDKSGAVGAGEQ